MNTQTDRQRDGWIDVMMIDRLIETGKNDIIDSSSSK
jgi:hypothetical protein